ncbi:MAG TPA: ATP-binding cassette domain-containing protein [Saprospiraceae bacterium]|nr:ATP-binding cassette domain-containing protein [Saprospiraceae bacterium]
MIIEVENLVKVFNGKVVVNQVSFSSEKPEIIGLLGANGAGKSTTLKILAGYIRPSSGTANILGMNVEAHTLEVKKITGYLPESNPLYSHMYVREFLQFIAQLHQIPNRRQRVEEVIEMTGLPEVAGKVISTLSKGFKQRTGIAQALVHDPKILILDEPTSGLDAHQILVIRELIQNLGKSKTILFSSHIMQEIESLCHRVMIIHEGKLLHDNTIESIKNLETQSSEIIMELENPSHNLQAYSLLHPLMNIVPTNQNSYRIQIPDGYDIRPQIFKTAVSIGDVIIKIDIQKNSMESVFRKLTSKP